MTAGTQRGRNINKQGIQKNSGKQQTSRLAASSRLLGWTELTVYTPVFFHADRNLIDRHAGVCSGAHFIIALHLIPHLMLLNHGGRS